MTRAEREKRGRPCAGGTTAYLAIGPEPEELTLLRVEYPGGETDYLPDLDRSRVKRWPPARPPAAKTTIGVPIEVPGTFFLKASTEGWLDTGHELARGKAVVITARGTATWGGRDDEVGPGGGGSRAHSSFIAPGERKFALVARVGGGKPRFIGTGPVELTGPGKLELGFNDDIFRDNGGGFEVTVEPASPSTDDVEARRQALLERRKEVERRLARGDG